MNQEQRAFFVEITALGVVPFILNIGIYNKTDFSCIPDKDIRVFYLDRQFFSCTSEKDWLVSWLFWV